MNNKLLAIALFLIFVSNIGYSQDSIQYLKHTSHLKLVQIEQGNSYVTSPFDIGNIQDLKFEGDLIPYFIIRENDRAPLMLVLTSQIKIRMFNVRSLPVRTPSYMPYLTLYYSIGDPYKRKIHSVFFRYEHHSNGQEDSTIFDNGQINLKSGDFSTNFLELGAVKAFYYSPLKSILFFESSFEYHFKKYTQPKIIGMYSLYRWNNRVSLLSPYNFFRKNGSFQLDARINWLFGELNGWKTTNSKRLTTDFTVYYSPNFLKEVGFFVQYYRGMDYYNIYFNQHLSMLRFGLMTELLRF